MIGSWLEAEAMLASFSQSLLMFLEIGFLELLTLTQDLLYHIDS